MRGAGEGLGREGGWSVRSGRKGNAGVAAKYPAPWAKGKRSLHEKEGLLRKQKQKIQTTPVVPRTAQVAEGGRLPIPVTCGY